MQLLNNGQRTTNYGLRTAFTLIELLVVILIILILIGLLSAAVVQALSQADKVANKSDIDQLAGAVEKFKTRFKCGNPPSRLRLREDGAYNTSIPIDADSLAFLMQCWPRITFPIDWNQNGMLDAGYADLEGDQCLVFFLGGVQASNPRGCIGFSTNPANPWQATGQRDGPFYEFKSDRLVSLGNTPQNPNRGPFYSYIDGYKKQPYLYFSSYKSANGYNRYYNPAAPVSDCPSAAPASGNPAVGVWPYAESMGLGGNPAVGTAPRYLNPNGFQIISAGKDTVFGLGTPISSGPPANPWTTNALFLWSPGKPTTFQVGKDDQANFHDKQLGS